MIALQVVAALAWAPAHAAPRAAVVAQYSGYTARGLESLTGPQQKAMVDATSTPEFVPTTLLEADPTTFTALREEFPALASLSDDELLAAVKSYINTPPTLPEVLLKTPVGPVIGINLLFYFTGFSACDLPFVDSSSQSCMELAARVAAQ